MKKNTDAQKCGRRDVLRAAGAVGATAAVGGLATGSAAATGGCTAANERTYEGSLDGYGDGDTYTYATGEDTCRVELALSGADGTDFDLYATLDGREPTPRDYDRRSWTYGSDESITVSEDVDELGLLVHAYSGTGEYELSVTEYAGDGDGGDGNGDGGYSVTYESADLVTLDRGYYEGWLVYGDRKVSTGKFRADDDLTFDVDRDPTEADRVVVTIEPEYDYDPDPSGIVYLSGPVEGDTADLSFPVEFDGAAGSYVLGTPTDDAAPPTAGVWFLDPPAGGAGIPPIAPGGAFEFTVEASPGDRLSLASMFVPSNDLFLSPGPDGIELFDGDSPVEGSVTDAFGLYDAGTEPNGRPGFGEDQAPLQDGPDQGADEGGVVRGVEDVYDGYDYPAADEVLEVSLTPRSGGGSTTFTVRVENVADPEALDPEGATGGAVLVTPGAYAVHDGPNPIYATGEPASQGLEAIAEAGRPGGTPENAGLVAELRANSRVASAGAFGPGDTVTDPNDPQKQPSASLDLPDLPTGWTYEGWAVTQGQPVSTGRFDDPAAADGFDGHSGDGSAPPLPGEDLVNDAPHGVDFPANLADGNSKVVVTVEPDLNGYFDPTGPAPFHLKPLVADVPATLGARTPAEMTANADIAPEGTATLSGDGGD